VKPFRLTAKYPTEHQEQVGLMKWAWYRSSTFPELDLLFAVANGGKRDAATGARLKAEGVKPGVPDLMLPVPRGNYSGLFIELKKRVGGKVSPHQQAWIDRLRQQGYAAVVCNGASEAIKTLEEYLAHDNA
jgi:hypothetical protein